MPALAIAAALLAAAAAVPIINVASSAFLAADTGVWQHLIETVLLGYVLNSITLVAGVGALACLFGIPAAWLTAACDFRFRKLFVWLLPLPLVMPAYIIAYTYTGLLDYPGPVQSYIRDVMGWSRNDYWFVEIRSLGGAIAMLGFVLYPYVYLLARAAFLERSMRTLEVSRTLGQGGFSGFFRLSLPLARPAIATGVALVGMETLADYGTVQYFGVTTFTTGIFRTFYGFGDPVAAMQLSAVLLGFVALLILLERLSRRRARFDSTYDKSASNRIRLNSRNSLLAWLFCGLPVMLGFVIPVLVLLKYALFDSNLGLADQFVHVWNSLRVAALAAVISVTFALVLGFIGRQSQSRIVKSTIAFASLGYAIPGTVIALGILSPVIWLDHKLIRLIERLFDINPGLLLSGSLAALLYAYTVRFMAISLGSVSAGMEKIGLSLDHSARTLGSKPAELLFKVHLPLLRSTILSALLIVFVDVLKELPATLVLRPFNFNTLAVRAYELASDERLADAAVPSLLIVLVGILPVIYLTRTFVGDPAQSGLPSEQHLTRT